MSHRVCSRCGAPLPAASARVVRCEFCGIEEVLEGKPPVDVSQVSPTPFAPPAPPPPSAAAPVLAVSMVLGVLVAAGAVAFALVSSSPTTSTKTITTVVSPPMPVMAPTSVSLSKLHTAPITWTQDLSLDAPGRIGPDTAFDPLANWDWAASIGTAWWSDAIVLGVEANPIRADGTVDLTGPSVSSIPPSVEYHFGSKDCLAAQKKRAETEVGFEETSCSLELQVKAGNTRVRMDLIGYDHGGHNTGITKPSCTVAQAFTKLTETKKLTTRPTYAVTLDGDGMRVSNGLGSATMDSQTLAFDFCGAKPPPRPAVTVSPSPTVSASPPPTATVAAGPPFDRSAALAAIKGAPLASCSNGGNPIRVAVTFEPSGKVSTVRVTDQNAGTPSAVCVTQKLHGLQVPAFGGSPVTVSIALTP